MNMTLRGNTAQACAACKYQRRKCTPECPLAPYFPPDQPKIFRNVHRLFGVSKVQKLLDDLPPSQHNEAMSSIIYQAEIRDRFPVFGCVEVIQLLRNQIRQCEEEHYAVHAMLQNPQILPQQYSTENAIPVSQNYSDTSSNSPSNSTYLAFNSFSAGHFSGLRRDASLL